MLNKRIVHPGSAPALGRQILCDAVPEVRQQQEEGGRGLSDGAVTGGEQDCTAATVCLCYTWLWVLGSRHR